MRSVLLLYVDFVPYMYTPCMQCSMARVPLSCACQLDPGRDARHRGRYRPVRAQRRVTSPFLPPVAELIPECEVPLRRDLRPSLGRLEGTRQEGNIAGVVADF